MPDVFYETLAPDGNDATGPVRGQIAIETTQARGYLVAEAAAWLLQSTPAATAAVTPSICGPHNRPLS
jgi:hypothetical protein